MLIGQLLEHIDDLDYIIELNSEGFTYHVWRLADEDISPILDYYIDDWRIYVDPLGCLNLLVSNQFWG